MNQQGIKSLEIYECHLLPVPSSKGHGPEALTQKTLQEQARTPRGKTFDSNSEPLQKENLVIK